MVVDTVTIIQNHISNIVKPSLARDTQDKKGIITKRASSWNYRKKSYMLYLPPSDEFLLELSISSPCLSTYLPGAW
jgi:hypothetical protein